MKAIVYYNYGSPDVLQYEEIEKPAAGDNEVLIKVRAASINGGVRRRLVPRRTINQDLLSRLNLSLVPKTLQRGECRHRYGSCLLERDIIRLHDQCRLGSTNILGKGPLAMDSDFGTRSLWVADTHAEHLVAWFELRYVSANRFNLAGHINTWPAWVRDRRFAQPEHNAKDVWHALQ